MGIEQMHKRARHCASSIQDFIRFAGVYLSLAVFFLLINLFGGLGNLWFFWPLVPLTMPLIILAWRAFALSRFNDQWVGQQVQKSLNRRQPAQRRADPRSEIDAIEEQAADLINSMRRSARQIPKPAVRAQALDACASADRVIAAIRDNPEEVALARDFVSRYMAPASSIMNDYSRLASRNIASAEPTLQRVEDHDLPLLEQKLNEVHDRLHRGSIIDLQVAREMLSLDVSNWGVEEIGGETLPAGDTPPVRTGPAS